MAREVEVEIPVIVTVTIPDSIDMSNEEIAEVAYDTISQQCVFVRGAQRLVEYTVTDENGKPVCARNNQRDAVVAALRIASETKRGAVQVVGE